MYSSENKENCVALEKSATSDQIDEIAQNLFCSLV